MSSPNANGALQPSARPSRGTMLARIAISAVFAATAMAVPQFTAPETAAAASSCTGWTSQTLPPTTIKVLRTDSGKVQKVDFRRYVAEVMASGEWPSRLRKATLEAGAVATKQYAWYHAMKGHHRSAYVRGGSCYDVRDDTRDQLYRPASAKPTTKQLAAVQKTWGLSLRKKRRLLPDRLSGRHQQHLRCGRQWLEALRAQRRGLCRKGLELQAAS